MKLRSKIILFILISLIVSTQGIAQRTDEFGNPILKELSEEDALRIFGESPRFFKTEGDTRSIKESIISGNNITTILFNYGSITAPNRLGNIADLVWQGLGYGFEFGPLAAAEVMGDSNQVLQIVSDSFIRTFQGDYDPDGILKWGWLPTPGYVDTSFGQNEIARLSIGDSDGDGKPDSWPQRWYSEGAGKYVWPAFLGDQATAPDEEVYFVIDDFTNAEFPYSPSPSDPTKHGLGLSIEVRTIQFSNPLAGDIMFLVYQITNKSEKNLEGAYFGMHGDPHIGGPSDFGDDFSGFIDPFGHSSEITNVPQRARNMVYSWDDPPTGMGGLPTGYFGWKFLESPSNAKDVFDNDDDGITDETPENSAGFFIDGTTIPLETGISDVEKYTEVYGAPRPRFSGDEDGDWNIEKDDIGIDGIGPDSPNYPGADYGEGDGEPSQAWFFDSDGDGDYTPGEPINDDRIAGYIWAGSEPNFGLRDISESDQIGLSAFHAAVYTNSLPNVPMNDPLMWEWLSSDSIVVDESLLAEGGDNVFNFGTGPLDLEVGETQRFSMAILFGNNLDELILNAETSTKILEADYRFAQPPSKPVVSASAVDGKVILAWDTRAEESVDPLSGVKDFQGYKIYRSRDYTFADAFTITDGRGNPFLGKGLAQWDLVDSLSGYHPVEYPGRAVKYFIGDNQGIVHQYVDSSVTNGVTYFYAVVAFDGGTNEIPPTENKATVHRDPLTGEFTFETNTLMITPGVLSQGLIDAEAGIGGTPNQILGNSTGDINILIMDELAVEDKLYIIDFIEDDTYNVYDSTGTKDEFTSKDTVFVDLSKMNINASSAVVVDAGGSIVDPSKYIISEGFGKIRGAVNGDLPLGEIFTITYSNFPVYQSTLIDDEDANPVFDGQRIFVQNHTLDLDIENSSWNDDANPDINVRDSLLWSPSSSAYIGNPHVQYRANWEVRWLDTDTLEDGSWANIGDSALAAPLLALAATPFNLVNISEVDAEGNYVKGEFLIDETRTVTASTSGNGQWDWGESILIRPTDPQGATVSYFVEFSLKKDSVIINEEVIDDTTSIFDTTIVVFEPILPEEGDIYTVRTQKPFEAGDLYEYNTKSASFSSQEAKNDLDNIYVVPNPYVAFSIAEEPGRTPDKRGDRLLQFRNLPPECTIRIYTITGELVETINKNDFTSMAAWDLLSFEGQRVAYGVYVYHIDVPGVGEKIGRIAVIK